MTDVRNSLKNYLKDLRIIPLNKFLSTYVRKDVRLKDIEGIIVMGSFEG